MARDYSYRSERYNEDDRTREQDYDRSSRRGSYGRSNYETRGSERDYYRPEYERESDYSSRDRDVNRSRDYGRRVSTGSGYGTAFGSSMRPPESRERFRSGSSGFSGRDYQRESYNPYRREYGADDPDYLEGTGRHSQYGQEGYGRWGHDEQRGFGRGSQGYDYGRHGRIQGERGGRGWWDRVSDEVASWFGDEEAERRRRIDEARDYRGRGPRGYRRSDDRIREDINDRLTDHPHLDASDISVEVNETEVILTGSVNSRWTKRLAEDIAESVSGVTYVQNNLRVNRDRTTEHSPLTETAGTMGTVGRTATEQSSTEQTGRARGKTA